MRGGRRMRMWETFNTNESGWSIISKKHLDILAQALSIYNRRKCGKNPNYLNC